MENNVKQDSGHDEKTGASLTLPASRPYFFGKRGVAHKADP